MASTNEKFKITSVLFKSMNFKDKYTTEAIKAEIIKDDKVSAEVKKAEEKKMIVSNDTMLNAEMMSVLINKLGMLIK
jgi:hypothetical protein